MQLLQYTTVFFNSKCNAVHARALVHMIPKKPFGIDKYKFQLCMDLFWKCGKLEGDSNLQ